MKQGDVLGHEFLGEDVEVSSSPQAQDYQISDERALVASDSASTG